MKLEDLKKYVHMLLIVFSYRLYDPFDSRAPKSSPILVC